MTLAWSDPGERQFSGRTPYVEWWAQSEGALVAPLVATRPFVQPREARAGRALRTSMGLSQEVYQDAVPIPRHALNPAPASLPEAWQPEQIAAHLPRDLPDDTVLTGIVDTGLPLSHWRTRFSDGRTRFIASWQQTATHAGQSFLPFGQELYAADIERLIRANSTGASLEGRLDEEAFNRDARLVEPGTLLGHRDLDARAAHGAHVLDLACGFDPRRAGGDAQARRRIIAVNLPPKALHGSSGNFLALWAVYAIERIVHVADALWLANHPGATGRQDGYPLVINFSYGMQAGPKTGTSPLDLAIRAIVENRATRFRAPTRINMPAGNENVDRVYARALMGGAATWKKYELLQRFELPWRILPADHTSNFVEIWTTALSKDDGAATGPPDAGAFALFVSPPGHPDLCVPRLRPGEYSALGEVARVSCMQQDGRIGFVLAVGPTIANAPSVALAPAGAWKIRLDYRGAVINVDMSIQSDQSVMPGSRTGRKSRFDHASAVPYLETGRPRDSFDYVTKAHTDAWPQYGPVQIKGTQNALASSDLVNVVGGYRVSDGKPAIYSSTNDGDSKQNGKGREILDASYPSEDAPSLFGLLAAGSRDGTVVGYRGTSMATALATRDIGAALQGWAAVPQMQTLGDLTWLRDRAGAFLAAPDRPAHYVAPARLKAGVGQIPYPDTAHHGRVKRV